LQLDWNVFEQQFRPEEKRASWHSDAESAREKNLHVLGLDETASPEEVRSAYRSLVKIYHPDRFANEPSDVQRTATEKFRKIQEAYEQLTAH
jgi:DnaJ-class molecular chaperone